jgi:hypothetical protein
MPLTAVAFLWQEVTPENEESTSKRVVFILEELQSFLESYADMHQVRKQNAAVPPPRAFAHGAVDG